uniref:Telomeric repeat-binding factor 2-interacting protein 1 n=1 Tax=Cyprinodon variegatus TaxID=28743 RepID=A0A3Q2FTN1_CYPVA
MSYKQPISPVLFWTVEGEPMTFFLRPGPVKRQLQPLITSGGGILSKVQKPGAILLIDPDEKTSISYIHDCIEKEEQLNLEDYRLNPVVTNRVSPRLNRSGGSPSALTGRVAYTPEDDAAILNFINQRKGETGGNRLWQEMEKQQVTSHSWQSMKSRYRDRLAKKQPGVIETEIGEETDKLPENEKEEQTDNQASTEILEAEREASPTPVLPKSPPPAQQKSSSKTSSTKRPKKKQEPSPLTEQPRRRLTRRQLDLEASFSSPESYDLVSVTKALLKTSGDFASAVDLLLNPSFVSAPLWNRHDDGLLHSTDPTVRRMLQEKYGEESLAKRIAFLEVEG